MSTTMPPESGVTCARCGAPNRPGAKFCVRCGYSVNGAAVPKPPGPPRHERSVPARETVSITIPAAAPPPVLPPAALSPAGPDAVTRYLCAGVHADPLFADSAITEYLLEPTRPVS